MDPPAVPVARVDIGPLQPKDLATTQAGVDGHADDRVIGRRRCRGRQQLGNLDRLEVRALLRLR